MWRQIPTELLCVVSVAERSSSADIDQGQCVGTGRAPNRFCLIDLWIASVVSCTWLVLYIDLSKSIRKMAVKKMAFRGPAPGVVHNCRPSPCVYELPADGTTAIYFPGSPENITPMRFRRLSRGVRRMFCVVYRIRTSFNAKIIEICTRDVRSKSRILF